MNKLALTLAIVVGIVGATWGIETWCDRYRPRTPVWLRVVVMLALCALIWSAGIAMAPARDLDGRYAASPLKQWFDSLRSGKGPCCSDADGSAVSDVDWESRDGRYRVRIEGQWWDVPDDAVITEPNRAGVTMVWPVYYRSLGAQVRIEIRCFMPGPMT
jgi:hypothetical protein